MSPLARPLALSMLTLAAAGCASIPRSSASDAQIAALDCERLADERAQTQSTREAAAQARSNAWKGVLPLVVGVRYASARSALSGADERLALIERQRTARGCAPDVAPAATAVPAP